MNSRQRVLAALNHQPVDRLPIDLGGTRQSGISAFSYARLRRELGLAPAPVKIFDTFQILAEIEPEILARFGSDCVALNRRAVAFGVANENWKPWQLHDGTDVLVPGGFNPEREPNGDWVLRKAGAIIARMPAGGFYFDRYERYPGAAHPDLATWSAPRLAPADLDFFAREARRLSEESDKAVIAAMGPPYELFNGIGQGGFEEWMMTFAEETDYVAALYDRIVDAWLANLRAFWQVVGERVQIIQIADDLGTQHSPFLSVEMFRERVMPWYKRGLDWIHQNTPWKVLMHTDGAIFPLIPSLIEMGVDALNPVQTSAAGMDAARLKATFGHKLAFWGGACDSQGVLSRGTPEQVAAATAASVQTLGESSGYVCASVHNIQAEVPAPNIIAMFDAARSSRGQG